MLGILYFSATGNSLYIAKKIKESLGGELRYIPSYTGDCSEFDKVILVTPIHSYGLPKLVFDFLPRMNKNKELIIVQNYGGMVGGADYYAYSYCKNHGLNIRSVFVLKMPESFTTTFTVPKFYIKSTLKKADGIIDKVISDIKNEKFSIPKQKKTKEKKYLTNMSNWNKIAKSFCVSEECVRCGKCVNVCPVKNISIENNKVVFGDKCIACLGCYHRCPQKAIRYKNHKKKDRYFNPNVDENEIGKDLK